MFMIQLSTQRNFQFSFHDLMYNIHSLDDPYMVKWAELHFTNYRKKKYKNVLIF